MSVVLRPAVPPARAAEITLVAAVAVVEAARERARMGRGSVAQRHRMQGRKIAGLLTELRTEADRVRHAVLGVGFNVSLQLSDFPEELRARATSSWSRPASGKRGPGVRAPARAPGGMAQPARDRGFERSPIAGAGCPAPSATGSGSAATARRWKATRSIWRTTARSWCARPWRACAHRGGRRGALQGLVGTHGERKIDARLKHS